uniref:Uncharacterized protein n=1 Tax=Sphaerodactylus townsendi TaxID=933632 RepID=A0ACB8GEV7_9SAUR
MACGGDELEETPKEPHLTLPLPDLAQPHVLPWLAAAVMDERHEADPECEGAAGLGGEIGASDLGVRGTVTEEQLAQPRRLPDVAA